MENRVLQAQKTRHQREHLKNKEQQQKRKGQAEGEEGGGKQTHKNKSGEEKKKSLTNTAENRTPEERPEREEIGRAHV